MRTEQGQHLKELFRCDGELIVYKYYQCFQSLHLLYIKARDDKGAHTEHKCCDCSASEEDNPSPEGFVQSPEVRASGGTFAFWDSSPCVKNALEFSNENLCR